MSRELTKDSVRRGMGKRKIIQISHFTVYSPYTEHYIMALCNDHTLWKKKTNEEKDNKWEQIENVPQDKIK